MVKITEMMGNESSSDEESDTDSPICPYGLSCYRKNPTHFKEFRHPHKDINGLPRNLNETFEVKIEIGHRSSPLPAADRREHSHEWMVFVRGAEGNRLEHIVDKIIFHLPQAGQCTVREPPYMEKQFCSKSFPLVIDLYFKDLESDRKVSFMYDVRLEEKSTFEFTQIEKVNFSKPLLEFRQKLLRAGGKKLDVQNPNSSSSSNSAGPSGNKRKRTSEDVSVGSPTHEYNTFGLHCASKLKAINDSSPTQKVIAEKLISEVLYHAQMNSLSTETCINLASNVTASVKTEPDTISSTLPATPPIKQEILEDD